MSNQDQHVDLARRALLKALGATGAAVAIDRLLLPKWFTPEAAADGVLLNGPSKDSLAHTVGGPPKDLGSEPVPGSQTPGSSQNPNDLIQDSGGLLDEGKAGCSTGGSDGPNAAFTDNDGPDDLLASGPQDMLSDGTFVDNNFSEPDSFSNDSLEDSLQDSLFEQGGQDFFSAGGANDICVGF